MRGDANTTKERCKPGGDSGVASTLNLENTFRYLGIDVDDALEIGEQTEV